MKIIVAVFVASIMLINISFGEAPTAGITENGNTQSDTFANQSYQDSAHNSPNDTFKSSFASLSSAATSGKLIIAQGDGFSQQDELFTNRPSDFTKAKEVFNTVILSPNNQTHVTDAVNAGMGTIIELDRKWDFIAGADISADVQEVIDQVKNNPNTISGIHVADRLNSWANDPDGDGPRRAIPPAKMIEYLSLTGGEIHKQLPGMPVYVDVENHNLTCDQPGQSSCAPLNETSSMYRYETNEVLTQLKDSGYIDGFFIANNLSNSCTTYTSDNCWNPDVQRNAWSTARQLWPSPFKIIPRTSRLSFPEATYPHDSIMAARQVAATITIPLEEGADGADVWGWHIPWEDYGAPSVRTWLNKDGSSNILWQEMQAAAAAWKEDGDVENDTAAPSAPSQLKLTFPAERQVSLTWNTSTDNTAVTGYNIYRNGSKIGTTATTSYLDTTAPGDSSYTYAIRAVDAAANESINSNSLLADLQRPTPPANIRTNSVRKNTVLLAWDPSTDNIKLTGYRIFRGTTLVATTDRTRFLDTGVIAGSTYSYTIVAYDASKNTSTVSNTLQVTTLP